MNGEDCAFFVMLILGRYALFMLDSSYTHGCKLLSVNLTWRLRLTIPRLLFSINVPHHIIWQTHDLVACSFCHLGKAFRLSLVFKCITGEIDSCLKLVVDYSQEMDAC